MAESAFSEDGNYFASISKDGRLRIWDTETNVLKQEYTPDLHLTSPPSCLIWIKASNVGGSSQSDGKQRHGLSYEQETQYVALGTTSGNIIIYSVTQGRVETILIDKQQDAKSNNSISAMDWHKKYGFFSCNKSGVLYEWHLPTSGVRNKYVLSMDNKFMQGNTVSAIKIVPHNLRTKSQYVVVASSQVHVWRLSYGESTLVRQLRHNAASGLLLSLVSIDGASWLVEGSLNERLLSFWDVSVTEEQLPQVNGNSETPSKRSRTKSSTVLTTITPAYNFVLEDAPKFINVRLKSEEEGKLLNIVAATRSGVVHYYGHMLNGTSSKPIKPSVTIQTTTAEAKPLSLIACRLADEHVLVGYISGPTTVFEKILPDTSSKTQILIRGERKVEKKKVKHFEVNKTRSDPGFDGAVYVEPVGVSRKRQEPGAEVEVPMESRLQNLSMNPKSRGSGATNQNLSKLLVQGLQSNDEKMLFTVLCKSEKAIALRTVSALPLEYVPALLKQLTLMANKGTWHCSVACVWAGALVQRHAAWLLAGGAHSQQLAALLGVLTHRRSQLCQLLNARGRIHLMLDQRAAAVVHTENAPVLRYNDSSSEEEEMEIENAESASDHSWEEEEEERASEEDPSDDEGE